MQLSDLIKKGYFPKELPPPFNTDKLAANVVAVLSAWRQIFDQNGNESSASFVLTQTTEESNKAFKTRKRHHAYLFRACLKI